MTNSIGRGAQLRSILDSLRDGYVELDQDTILTGWNLQSERMLGWTREEIVGRSAFDIVGPGSLDMFEQGMAVIRTPEVIEEMNRGGRPGRPLVIEIELVHKDGTLSSGTMSVFAEGIGTELRIWGFIHDASAEASRFSEAIARDRQHDPLTGLPNRNLFSRRVQVALNDLKDEPGTVSLVVFGVDRFKIFNDSMGHDAGDDLLVALVARLRMAGGGLRPLLARLGGDEFLALFEGERSTQDASRFVDDALEAMREPFDIGGTEVFLVVSAGIATTKDPTTDRTTLLSNAGAAMHEAKEDGGGTYKVFGEAMRRHVVEQMSTEHGLNRALERGELVLFYQPVVDISTLRTVGAEAVLRWDHPKEGLLAPDRFVPVAELSGLIVPIGAWALAEACRQWVAWQAAGLFGPSHNIGVNLAVRQIEQPEIVRTVRDVLTTTGLAPGNLTLEITESALMRDRMAAGEVLADLKALGTRLAIDDFGTGYSSLSYLQQLPLDSLKIDKSFVDQLDRERGTQIVAAVISMARALGHEIVAEGVETPTQLNALRLLGCERAQGFLFSPPVSGDRFPDIVGR